MKKLFSFLLACAVGMSTMVTTACSSSQALADVQRFEPVVINVLVLACTISPASQLCGTAKATIQADYNLVITLWSDYNTAVASGTATPGMWNDLNAAFATFEKDSGDIFALGLGINAPEVTAIVASAQVLLAAIESLFPAAPAGANVPKSALFAAHALGRTQFDKKWLENWAVDYNDKVEVAKRSHKQAKLAKVYVHGELAHFATAGLLK